MVVISNQKLTLEFFKVNFVLFEKTKKICYNLFRKKEIG